MSERRKRGLAALAISGVLIGGGGAIAQTATSSPSGKASSRPRRRPSNPVGDHHDRRRKPRAPPGRTPCTSRFGTESGAATNCVAGQPATVMPPSGPVVSDIYMLVPMGFAPPGSSLQCGTRCIDQPRTMDMSHVLGGLGSNATLPPRSFVIEDAESFQSTWWPVVLVGVKTLDAWHTIVNAKTIEAVDACQKNGGTRATAYFSRRAYSLRPRRTPTARKHASR
ncbi:MAG: hypothetical protein ABI595_15215 [Actinomycetota bacterium]